MIYEARVQAVIAQTGMGYLQAIHRVQQEQELQTRPNPYPLGRNASIDHDAEYAAWAKRNPELAAAHA